MKSQKLEHLFLSIVERREFAKVNRLGIGCGIGFEYSCVREVAMLSRSSVLLLAIGGWLCSSSLVPSLHAEKPRISLAPLRPALADSTVVDSKIVYVDFWASWCAPCRLSFPWMVRLQERLRDQNLQIIAISVDKDVAMARKFAAEMGATFPIVYDSTGQLAKRFELEAMPSSFVFGPDGRLRDSHRGFVGKDTIAIASLIRNAIEESKKK